MFVEGLRNVSSAIREQLSIKYGDILTPSLCQPNEQRWVQADGLSPYRQAVFTHEKILEILFRAARTNPAYVTHSGIYFDRIEVPIELAELRKGALNSSIREFLARARLRDGDPLLVAWAFRYVNGIGAPNQFGINLSTSGRDVGIGGEYQTKGLWCQGGMVLNRATIDQVRKPSMRPGVLKIVEQFQPFQPRGIFGVAKELILFGEQVLPEPFAQAA